MARIENFGVLDWDLCGYSTHRGNLDETGKLSGFETLRQTAGAPAIEQTGKTSWDLHFKLRFDDGRREGQGKVLTFCGEEWTELVENDRYIEIPIAPETVFLPQSVRKSLERLRPHLALWCILVHDVEDGIDIVLGGYQEPIRQPDRFLKSLARKLSRWANEA